MHVILFQAAYTANLASLLVEHATPDLKIRDIEDAIDRRINICVQGNSYSDEYMREMYPQSIPYLVPRTPDLMYDSLNAGECEIMLAYKQEFEMSLYQKEDNPTCTLDWEGRQVKSSKDGFVTKLDPGVKCTDLVNEVFNYFMKEMDDNGFLEEKWREHTEYYATPGHCNHSSDSAKREFTNSANRYLKADGGDGTGEKSADSTASAEESDEESSALSLKQMAGTMVFQVIGSVIAIVIALVSRFERKKNVKRQIRRRTKKMVSKNSDATGSDESSVQIRLDELAQQMNTMMKMMQKVENILDGNEQFTYTAKSMTTGSFETNENGVVHATSIRGSTL